MILPLSVPPEGVARDTVFTPLLTVLAYDEIVYVPAEEGAVQIIAAAVAVTEVPVVNADRRSWP